MRFLQPTFLSLAILATSAVTHASNNSIPGCVPFSEADKLMGSNACVTGTVQHIAEGRGGVKVLAFCKELKCSFTVIVFPADLKKMGDIQQLAGHQIEIKGTIQDYDGHAEIILRRSNQLGEGAFLLFPPVPTEYDVERGPRKASGSTHAKSAKKEKTRQGDPISIDDPGEP
jgi:hypothetical protein